MIEPIVEFISRVRPDLEGHDALLDTPLRVVFNSIEFVEFLTFLDGRFPGLIAEDDVTEANFANARTLITFLEGKGPPATDKTEV